MTNMPLQPGHQPPPYPGAPPAAAAPKPKTPWFAKWWVWVLAVIVLIVVASAMNGGNTNQANAPAAGGTQQAASEQAASEQPAPEPKEPLTLDKGWKIDKSNQFAVFVAGYVSNNTDKAITNYVQITFDALDSDGTNVGTCLANTNTIDASGRWKFKAMCSGEVKDIKKVRFKEITGF